MKLVLCAVFFASLFVTNAYAQTDVSAPISKDQVKDFIDTLIDKLQSATTTDDKLSNLTSDTKQIINSGIDLTTYGEYWIEALVGYVGPKILGHELPSWVIPFTSLVGIAAIAYGVWRHLKWIVITGMIIAAIALLIVYIGGSVLLP